MKTQRKVMAGILAVVVALMGSPVDLRAVEGVLGVPGEYSAPAQPGVSVGQSSVSQKSAAVIPGPTNTDTIRFLENAAVLAASAGEEKPNTPEDGRTWLPVENHSDVVYSTGEGSTIIKFVSSGLGMRLDGEATSVKVDGHILTFGGVQDPTASYNTRPQINLLTLRVLPATDLTSYFYSDAGWQSTPSNSNFAYVFAEFSGRTQVTTLRLIDLRNDDVFDLEQRAPVPYWMIVGNFSGVVDVSRDGKYVIYSYSQRRDLTGEIPERWFTVIREIESLRLSTGVNMIEPQEGGFEIGGKLLNATFVESDMVRLVIDRNQAEERVCLDLVSRIEIPASVFVAMRNYYRGRMPENATISSAQTIVLPGGGMRFAVVVTSRDIKETKKIASEKFIFEKQGARSAWVLKRVRGFNGEGKPMMVSRYFHASNGRLLFVLVLPYPTLWHWTQGFGGILNRL
jgi:hypothetical protein